MYGFYAPGGSKSLTEGFHSFFNFVRSGLVMKLEQPACRRFRFSDFARKLRDRPTIDSEYLIQLELHPFTHRQDHETIRAKLWIIARRNLLPGCDVRLQRRYHSIVGMPCNNV